MGRVGRRRRPSHQRAPSLRARGRSRRRRARSQSLPAVRGLVSPGRRDLRPPVLPAPRGIGARTALARDASLEAMGATLHDPIIIQVSYVATAATATLQLPPMAVVANAEQLKLECAALLQWEPGAAYAIPLLHAFTRLVGGYTRSGELIWREEERQVASFLHNGSFGQPAGEKRKRSVVMGSLGVGKSTLLCVLVVYVAVHKMRNVLVVRKLTQEDRRYCLFFLGHQGHEVVYSQVEKCALDDVIRIYRALDADANFPSVGLMLDGFVYGFTLAVELQTFSFLATSHQADIRFDEAEHTEFWLFPSWRRNDLFQLGQSIYKWNAATMAERFYCSGGSVREFTTDNIQAIEFGCAQHHRFKPAAFKLGAGGFGCASK